MALIDIEQYVEQAKTWTREDLPTITSYVDQLRAALQVDASVDAPTSDRRRMTAALLKLGHLSWAVVGHTPA